MKRIVVVLIGVVVLAGSGFVSAQAPAGFGPPAGMPAPGSLPGGGLLPSLSWIPGIGSMGSCGTCGDPGVRPWVVPRVRAGYQALGLNFDFPANISFLGFSIPQGVDFQVPRAAIWMGGVTLDFQIAQPLLVFVDAAGGIPKNVRAYSYQDPFGTIIGGIVTGSSINMEWSGTRLEWWKVDVGAALDLGCGFSVVGGLRRDQTSVALSDPRDTLGIFNVIQSISFLSTEYEADIQAKLWIPYFGIQIAVPNGRGRIIYSPFISSRVRVPVLLLAAASGQIFSWTLGADAAISWDNSLTQPGQFLEGSIEYQGQVTDGFSLGLWARGSWLHVRGKANADIGMAGDIYVRTPGGDEFRVGASTSLSESETATFSRTLLAGGLSLELSF